MLKPRLQGASPPRPPRPQPPWRQRQETVAIAGTARLWPRASQCTPTIPASTATASVAKSFALSTGAWDPWKGVVKIASLRRFQRVHVVQQDTSVVREDPSYEFSNVTVPAVAVPALCDSSTSHSFVICVASVFSQIPKETSLTPGKRVSRRRRRRRSLTKLQNMTKNQHLRVWTTLQMSNFPRERDRATFIGRSITTITIFQLKIRARNATAMTVK